jgi:hypothetical protein
MPTNGIDHIQGALSCPKPMAIRGATIVITHTNTNKTGRRAITMFFTRRISVLHKFIDSEYKYRIIIQIVKSCRTNVDKRSTTK